MPSYVVGLGFLKFEQETHIVVFNLYSDSAGKAVSKIYVGNTF